MYGTKQRHFWKLESDMYVSSIFKKKTKKCVATIKVSGWQAQWEYCMAT